jgi:hypothetical protein
MLSSFKKDRGKEILILGNRFLVLAGLFLRTFIIFKFHMSFGLVLWSSGFGVCFCSFRPAFLFKRNIQVLHDRYLPQMLIGGFYSLSSVLLPPRIICILPALSYRCAVSTSLAIWRLYRKLLNVAIPVSNS